MATLTLARRDVCFDAKLLGATSLTEWLNGRWALLFSHSQDFATSGFEADRWLCIVQSALEAAHVRCVSVPTRDRSPHDWIERVEGDALLVLDPPRRRRSEEMNARVGALRSSIARFRGRFVMVIDAELQLRGTLGYESGAHLPSVLDLIAATERLRDWTVRPGALTLPRVAGL